MQPFNEEESMNFIWHRLDKSINRQAFCAFCLMLFWYVRFMLCYHLVYFEIDDLLVCVLIAFIICVQVALRRFLENGKCSLAVLYMVWLSFLFQCLGYCCQAFVGHLRFYSCEVSVNHGKCVSNVNHKGAFSLTDDVCASLSSVVPINASSKSDAAVGSLVFTIFALAYAVYSLADPKLVIKIGELVVHRTIFSRRCHDDENPSKGFVNVCFDKEEGTTSGSGSDDDDHDSSDCENDDDLLPSYYSVEKGTKILTV